MKIKKGDSTFDKIKAFYADPDNFALTEKQDEIRRRWSEVLTLRLQYWSPFQIANKFKEDYGISTAQAYKDIRASESLFGNVLHSDKMGFRAILREYVMKFYQRALKAQNLKMQAKALELMGKFSGIEEQDLDFNPEKLENRDISIKVDRKIQKAMMDMLKGGVADFNGLMNKVEAVDAEYEEVDE